MSEQIQNNNIVTQKDLAAVITSVCETIDAGSKIVIQMNSAAKTINGVISKNEISKAITGLNKFQKNIDKYNLIIGSILNTLVKPNNSTAKSFAEFLGAVEEKDDTGKLTGKTKYTTVEAAQQIPNILASAFKALETMSSPQFIGKSARRIKRNMSVFIKSFDSTVGQILEMFTNMHSKYNMNELLKLLVKSPDVTINTITNDIKSEKGVDTDNSKTITKTINGKLGLLDGIAQMFTLFAALGQLQPPMRYKKLTKIIDNCAEQIKYIVEKFAELAKSKKDDITALNDFTTKLAGDNGITDLVMAIRTTTMQLVQTFNKNTIKQLSKILGKPNKDGKYDKSSLALFSEIFGNIITYIVNDVNLNKLSNEQADLPGKFGKVKTAINSINTNIEALIVLGKSLTMVRLLNKRIKNNIELLAALFGILNTSFSNILAAVEENTIAEVNKKIDEVSDEFKTTIDKIATLYIAIGDIKVKNNKNLNKINLLLNLLQQYFGNDTITAAINNITPENLNILNTRLDTVVISINKYNTVITSIIPVIDGLMQLKKKLRKGAKSAEYLNKLLNLLIKSFENIIKFYDEIISSIDETKIEKSIKQTDIVLSGIKSIIKKIVSVSAILTLSAGIIASGAAAALLVRWTFKIIVKTIRTIILQVNKIKNTVNQSNIVLSSISIILLKLVGISLMLAIYSPIFIAGAIGALIFNLTFKAVITAIRVVLIAVNRLRNIISRSIINIGLIFLIVSMISASMVFMSISAALTLPLFGKIMLFLLAYVSITAVITLLGYGLTFIAPYIAAAIPGFAVILIMIACLTATALALKALTSLELDTKAIKENIKLILSAARLVITGIFDNNIEANTENDDSNKGIWSKIISFIGGTVGTLIKAILSIRILMLTVVSVGIITIIAIQLRIIQMLNLDVNKIKTNVNLVITLVNDIVNIIFNAGKDPSAEKSDKNWLTSIFEFVGGSIAKLGVMILSVKFLATSISAIWMILILAIQLRILQMFNLEPDKIRTTVNAVITTVNDIINIIFNGDDTASNEGSERGWIMSVIEFVGGSIVNIAKAILAVRVLAISIAAIFLVTILAKQLSNISKIELSDKISDKVTEIINATNNVTATIFGKNDDTKIGEPDEKKKGFLSKIFSGLGDAVLFIASIPWLSTAIASVGLVSQLAEHLTTINNVPDVTNIVSKTEAVCNSADMLIKHMTTRPDYGGEVESNSRIDIIDKINQSIQSIGNIEQKQIKKIDKVFDDYSKFIDKVNTVDVAKLENSTKMFAQMANFSNSIKGDFTKLAETLNENLMPVLQELKEIMGVIPEKLDTGFQNTSASIAATTVAPTQETVTAQVNRENPSMTKKEVDNIVQQRMKDYSKTEATGVVAKLDQLIDLLKGYSGENVMVKTV
jgi:hypothetical protein